MLARKGRRICRTASSNTPTSSNRNAVRTGSDSGDGTG